MLLRCSLGRPIISALKWPRAQKPIFHAKLLCNRPRCSAPVNAPYDRGRSVLIPVSTRVVALLLLASYLLEQGITLAFQLLIPALIVFNVGLDTRSALSKPCKAEEYPYHVLSTTQITQHTSRPFSAFFGHSTPVASWSTRTCGEQVIDDVFDISRCLILKHDFL